MSGCMSGWELDEEGCLSACLLNFKEEGAMGRLLLCGALFPTPYISSSADLPIACVCPGLARLRCTVWETRWGFSTKRQEWQLVRAARFPPATRFASSSVVLFPSNYFSLCDPPQG